MSTYSTDLIQEFIQREDIKQLSGIFIQLYEDESISRHFIYPDSMRLLRNKAAHEPAMLLKAFYKSANKNCAVFVIEGERKVRIDWHTVLINLYNLYIQTADKQFIQFAATLLKVMQIPASPYVVSDMGLRMCNDDVMLATLQIIGESPILRTTNVTNDFHLKLLQQEPGKYLRLALPCWLNFITVGLQKVYPVDFYEYLVRVDKLRSMQTI